MASFGGHALPGFFFMLFGLWVIVRECLIYFKSLRRVSFLKTDGIVILTLIGIGCFVELFWPWNGNHPPFGNLLDPSNPNEFFKPMNWQHFTMYIFFGFYGVCRLLEYYIPHFCTGADRLAGGLAFFVEGYLFYNHVHGRSVLDAKIHMLIVLACMSSTLVWFVTFFLEDKRKVFILDVINAALMFAQGTWFWHVAFILYGKNPWPHGASEDDHDDDHDHHEMAEGVSDDHGHMMHEDHMMMDEEHVNTMFAVLFFTWHVAFALVLMIIIAVVIFYVLKRRGQLDRSFLDGVKNNNNAAYAKLSNKDYSESNLDEHQTPLLASVDDEENVLFIKD